MPSAASPPPIESLIPHRGTMLLIDALEASSPEESTARCAPDRAAWYADAQGDMPAWIGIELMAQAVAAHVSWRKQVEGLAPRPGVLLGTRRYVAHAAAFRAGEALRIRVRPLLADASGLGAYDCSIEAAPGQPLAQAQLKVFEPDDFDAFWQEARA